MQSEASSSSPKRSVSECPSHDSGVRSPPSDEISTLSPTDRDDIDTYMAEQENGQHDGALVLTAPPENGIVPLVLPENKFSLVQRLRSKQMQVGDTWYLVSRQWYKRWQKACTGEIDKEGAIDEKDVGPVNNSSLVDKDGKLVSSAIEGVDVEYVSQEVWSHLTAWLVYQ
jgi:ubiquitin carboxyl-terminal hydrolase 4/11